jgi:DNA-binding MarR family transcriptional regulator
MRNPDAPTDNLIGLLRDGVLEVVRQDGLDLNLRQLSVLLVCCSVKGPQTVNGLSQHLQVPKTSISRAAYRLEKAGLAKREGCPTDRRSVLITVMPAGRCYCARFFGGARGCGSEGPDA